jgi:SAM-dependent methyltransferase
MAPAAADDWDAAAATFDDEPDHGLRSPVVRAAWSALLERLIPSTGSRVADLGCGTGSLAVLLAEGGHRVTGLDAAPRMIDAAVAKAALARVEVDLRVGDAAIPALAPAAYDVVLARHVVWALPDPALALGAWVDLLAPGGRLVLVEGFWSTGSGLHAGDLTGLLAADGRLDPITVEPLTDPALWGGRISDERYAVTAHLGPESLPDKGVRTK